MTNTHRRRRLADGQLSSLYRPSPSVSSFGAASVCCAVSLLPRQTRPFRCFPINGVSFSSHSRCALYSSASFEGSTLSSFLRFPSLPPSFPSSFVLNASLSPSFPASLPPSLYVQVFFLFFSKKASREFFRMTTLSVFQTLKSVSAKIRRHKVLAIGGTSYCEYKYIGSPTNKKKTSYKQSLLDEIQKPPLRK